jgi:hypothetical protein
MKRLALVLEKAGFDPSSLKVLCRVDGQPVLGLEVPCRGALRAWRRLRREVPPAGRWPVLLGHVGQEDLPTKRTAWFEGRERRQTFPPVEDVLKEARELDAGRWLADRHAAHVKGMEEELVRDRARGYLEDAAFLEKVLAQPEPFRGLDREDWLGDERGAVFEFVAWDLAVDEDRRPVSVGLFPTAAGWEVPAWWKFGGWNHTPQAHESVAVLRYWHERYGAEVLRLTNDTLELAVDRPPKTREEALLLAKEQFYYCPDIITQGEGSLDSLAARLLGGEGWYFWWD